MPPSSRSASALVLGVFLGAAVSVSCYNDQGLLGAYCEVSSDCGAGQSCENGVCGMCRNGEIDFGELCYGPATDYLVGGFITAMLPVDFEETPGAIDLLTINNRDCGPVEGACWQFGLIYNDGEGNFTPTLSEPFVGNIASIAVDDLDGDGEPDAAVTLDNPNELDSLGGVFVVFDISDPGTDLIQLPLPATGLTAQIADFNGDGILDVASGSKLPIEDAAFVFLGEGERSFAPGVALPGGPGPRLGPPRDYDRDGAPDLAAVNTAAGTLTVLRNDGAGGFVQSQVLPTGDDPTFLASDHLDEDGLLDLAVVNRGSDTVTLYGGEGDATFEEWAEIDVGPSPAFALISDFNLDGRPDLLVTNSGSDKLSVLLGRASGVLPDQVLLDVSVAPFLVENQDFNGDGVGDLAVSTLGNLSIALSEY